VRQAAHSWCKPPRFSHPANFSSWVAASILARQAIAARSIRCKQDRSERTTSSTHAGSEARHSPSWNSVARRQRFEIRSDVLPRGECARCWFAASSAMAIRRKIASGHGDLKLRHPLIPQNSRSPAPVARLLRAKTRGARHDQTTLWRGWYRCINSKYKCHRCGRWKFGDRSSCVGALSVIKAVINASTKAGAF
jgi:hypothetical protein